MSREVAIRVRGLKTAYGTHIVHEHLDLDVHRGEVMGIIGPSGCGKSVRRWEPAPRRDGGAFAGS